MSPVLRRTLVSVVSALALWACADTPGISDPPDGTPGPLAELCSTSTTALPPLTVAIPARGGGTLGADLYRPGSASHASPCPMLVLLPGGGAPRSSVAWAAERLAANGYMTLIVGPSLGGSVDAYNQAARAGIDYLQSWANPVRVHTDTSRVGVAGWSLGGRALTRTQAEDARVDALVAWDNLAVSESGDDGSAACTNVMGTARAPRAPALGQASESCAGTKGPDAKKTAWSAWRTAGVPAVQVVFAGSSHFLWSGSAGSRDGWDRSHHYTRAWFDRWLRADTAATTRLLARSVVGVAVDALLSSTFRSAAFVDGHDCGDLRAACERSTRQSP